jgi:hypothetical protein
MTTSTTAPAPPTWSPLADMGTGFAAAPALALLIAAIWSFVR